MPGLGSLSSIPDRQTQKGSSQQGSPRLAVKGQIFQVFTAWKNQRYHPDYIFTSQIVNVLRPLFSLTTFLVIVMTITSFVLCKPSKYKYCFKYLLFPSKSGSSKSGLPIRWASAHTRTLLGQNNSPRYLFARDEGHWKTCCSCISVPSWWWQHVQL